VHRHERDAGVATHEEADRFAPVRQEDDFLDVAEVPIRQVYTEFLAVPKEIAVRPARLGLMLRIRLGRLDHVLSPGLTSRRIIPARGAPFIGEAADSIRAALGREDRQPALYGKPAGSAPVSRMCGRASADQHAFLRQGANAMVIRLPANTSKSSTERRARARSGPALPVPTGGFDRTYWLGHCDGYQVEGAEGRIGFVESVRVHSGSTVLAVRAGRLGRRILLVSADEVAFIVPRAKRLWLQTPATIIDSKALPTVEIR
jgi:hypothetical protein